MTSRQRISVGTGDFEVLVAEPAAGVAAPLALCLHGFPDHPPSFAPLLEALAGAGYRAVAPWLRGYAPSPLEGPFDVDRLAADVLALADALSPGRPAHLVGHDWGAVLTYVAASRWPERFASAVTMAVPHPVALLGALPRRPDQIRRSWYIGLFQLPWVAERALAKDDHALIERLYRGWSPGLTLPPAQMRALKDCIARSMPGPIAYYRAFLRPLGPAIRRGIDARRPERRIRVPLLSLMGEDDGCIGATVGEDDARLFTGRHEREILPGVGHFMHIEEPGAIAARVIRWLAEAH